MSNLPYICCQLDHPSKQLLKIDQSLCIREYQSLIYGSTYVMKQTLKQIACVMLLMMTKPNYPGALSNYKHSGVQQNKNSLLCAHHAGEEATRSGWWWCSGDTYIVPMGIQQFCIREHVLGSTTCSGLWKKLTNLTNLSIWIATRTCYVCTVNQFSCRFESW